MNHLTDEQRRDVNLCGIVRSVCSQPWKQVHWDALHDRLTDLGADAEFRDRLAEYGKEMRRTGEFALKALARRDARLFILRVRSDLTVSFLLPLSPPPDGGTVCEMTAGDSDIPF